jgi:membrane protease YdiL (CAAX protease family)
VTFLERFNALVWFLVAAAWFLFSDLLARRAAAGFTEGDWQEPLYRLCLLFLLIVGYWLMSRVGQRRLDVPKATALARRPGALGEFALGAALGWSGVVLSVLPAAVIGGLIVTSFTNGHQFWLLLPDLIALMAGTLAIEIAFRGYPFLRLVEAMGPVLAAFFMAVIYAIWRTHAAPATTATVLVSFFLGLVLATAVLRTRALWVGWGFHFAWIAAMSVLFGLPVAGSMDYSPILATNSVGPAWVTGNGQGSEGSAFAVLISFLLIFAMIRFTDDLKHKYGFREIVPGGMPIDLEAAARRQHEAAMAQAEPQSASLVQILVAPSAPLSNKGEPIAPPVSEFPAPQAPPDFGDSAQAEVSARRPLEQTSDEDVRSENPVSESDTESPR